MTPVIQRARGGNQVAEQTDQDTEVQLQAAAFRRLVGHLREHPEVQNMDLMNLAGFCRNCLAKWYRAAAEERGQTLDYEQARTIIYGMPYAEWKDKHQHEAGDARQAAFDGQRGK